MDSGVFFIYLEDVGLELLGAVSADAEVELVGVVTLAERVRHAENGIGRGLGHTIELGGADRPSAGRARGGDTTLRMCPEGRGRGRGREGSSNYTRFTRKLETSVAMRFIRMTESR